LVTGHWSEGSLVRRVSGPTVVADVGTISKREDGNSMHKYRTCTQFWSFIEFT